MHYVRLKDKKLVDELENVSAEILRNTVYLETKPIAELALHRVVDKKPPASKKGEFKDSAIWETVIELGRKISSVLPPIIFFTVNIDDFYNKGVTPHVPHRALAAEGAQYNVIIISDLIEIRNSLP